MNYETASDFELNEKLCGLLGMKVAQWFDTPFSHFTEQKDPIDRQKEYRERYPNTVWALKDGEPWEQYIFTSDWSQTMPLAVEHGVCITSPTSMRKNPQWSASWSEDGGRWSSGDTVATDKKLLRAIVICLIKVLEKK